MARFTPKFCDAMGTVFGVMLNRAYEHLVQAFNQGEWSTALAPDFDGMSYATGVATPEGEPLGVIVVMFVPTGTDPHKNLSEILGDMPEEFRGGAAEDEWQGELALGRVH